MQDSFTFAQGLPLAGKVLATIVVSAVWIFVCYAIWQKPKAGHPAETSSQVSPAVKPSVKSNTATKKPVTASDQRKVERGAKPKREQPANTAVVSVGNVSSQNQTGGVTAAYVSEVNQNQ